MKIAYFITTTIISITFLFFTACSSKEQSSTSLPELIQAETIMYQHPDSALHILQNMEMPDATQKLEHATWALLMTQAKYKMYIKQNDSLANIAYKYFMEQEEAQRKALVLYLKGEIFYDNKNIEEAQNFLLKATTYAEKTDDYQLCHLIYAELGCIYARRSYKEYALEAFNKAYQYAIQSKNLKYIISSQIYLGRTYTILEKINLAIESYQAAINIAKENHNIKNVIAASNELAGVYLKIKDYKKALYHAKQAINNNSIVFFKGQTNLIIGEIYNQMGQIDSAYYFFNQATLFKTNTFTVNEVYHALYNLSKKEHKYKDAIFYNDKYLIGLDSIYNSHRKQELAEMQEKYNQQKIINEKNQLKIEKDKDTRNALVTLLLLIFLIAVLIYIYQRKLMRKEHIIQKKEEDIRRSMIQISENEIAIKHNQARMQELNAQIKDNKGVQEQLDELNRIYAEMQQQNEALAYENQTLQKNIEQYSSTLNAQSEELKRLNELTEENQRLHDRERILSKQLVKNTKVLNELVIAPKYVDVTQWRNIEEAINSIFDNFTKRLSTKLPTLTEYEIHLCCLIKLNMNNTNMATALGISPASVSKQKYRLKEHIAQQNETLGRNQALDLWIWDF
ncbi:tetratricopeptide repeat protein [uncultured Bacteroides sp.]|uniref:tetratricopeptide repeat protein n=4 Tax=Bacteroides TaxID=816 RepID=UPI00259BBCAC|nr:tetratricopeptide repeat protein [uncultured Bacteroides sp.]